jgi:hypothetical protein
VRQPLILNFRVADPLVFKGPGLDSISFHIPSLTQTCRWNTLVGGIKLPVCKSLVSLNGAVGLKFRSNEFVSHETEGKSEPKSKVPSVIQRDKWATRRFKTASKPAPPRQNSLFALRAHGVLLKNKGCYLSGIIRS